MLVRFVAYIALALTWLVTTGPHAATLSSIDRSIPGMGGLPIAAEHVLRLTGFIAEGDAERMRAVLSALKRGALDAPLATVELSSPGGDLAEGVKLGYLFREFDVATRVRRGDTCISSCALAFVGGTTSHAGSHAGAASAPGCTIDHGGHVAFHNFYLNPESRAVTASLPLPDDGSTGRLRGFSEARGGAAMIVRYAADMGLDAGFVARILGTPPEEFEYVDTVGEYRMLHVCPFNLKRPPVGMAAQAANLCNHMLPSAQLSPIDATQMSARHARRRLLDQLRRTLAAVSEKGALAAELTALLSSRDDDLVETIYLELRTAGVPLPELFGQHFEIAGKGPDGEPVQCFVSFSLDNSDKYDVVIADRHGFSRPAIAAPAACPRLFLYDDRDVINPRP
ncbi:MAG: hypothetical protein JOY81_13805 [Alphaproteobacteria bacterium]|nr:hypothetical protein [Alphaproteobacteria bacterium]